MKTLLLSISIIFLLTNICICQSNSESNSAMADVENGIGVINFAKINKSSEPIPSCSQYGFFSFYKTYNNKHYVSLIVTDLVVSNQIFFGPYIDKYIVIKNGNNQTEFHGTLDQIGTVINSNSVMNFFEIQPPNMDEPLTISFYDFDEENCTFSNLICTELEIGNANKFQNNFSSYTHNYISSLPCKPQSCILNENIEGKKVGSDLVVNFKDITQSQFQALIDNDNLTTLAFSIEATGQNGSSMSTFVYPDIYNIDIENWTYTIPNMGGYDNYTITTYYERQNGNFSSCANPIQLHVTEDNPLCNILEKLKHRKDATTFKWDFTDVNNANYYTDVLNDLGYTA